MPLLLLSLKKFEKTKRMTTDAQKITTNVSNDLRKTCSTLIMSQIDKTARQEKKRTAIMRILAVIFWILSNMVVTYLAVSLFQTNSVIGWSSRK